MATVRKRRARALVGGLVLLLAAAGVGWLNQEYLKEQYYWRVVMGPTLLTADQDRALQTGKEFTECQSGCPVMVVVPAGKFMMGSPEGQGKDNEHPQHEVMIAKPFAVGKHEVTFAEWDACVAAGGCPKPLDAGWGRGERPVINVNWDDAQQYVTWLSSLTGKTYRLLTEAEWEYAARAGTKTHFSFGDDEAALGDYGWYSMNSDAEAHPVGEKKPNPFGLHDMHGNVSEWVEDCVHGDYSGAPENGSAWTAGGDCNRRVLRGGSWVHDPDGLRSALRDNTYTDSRGKIIGFRVARTLDQ